VTIQEAIKIIERRWDPQGMCASCGWHSLLSEYDLKNQITINEKEKRLELPCGSGESGHRGVRIYCKKAEKELDDAS